MQSCYLRPCLFPIQCDFIKSFAKVWPNLLSLPLSVQLCKVDILQRFSLFKTFVIIPSLSFNYVSFYAKLLRLPTILHFEYTTKNVMHVLIWSGLQMLDIFFTNGNLVDKKQKLIFLSITLASEKYCVISVIITLCSSWPKMCVLSRRENSCKEH